MLNKSKMTPVKSSNISHLHHDPATQTLTVRFHTGNQYGYSPVTSEEYQTFHSSPSIGRHFGEHIRNNPKFRVTPLGCDGGDTEVPEAVVA